MEARFTQLARRVSILVGSPYVCIAAFFMILLWACSGPFMNFSEVWQLTINTTTTIVTFLMVFLMQHAQNTDTTAIHKKLDEVIRVLEEANDDFIGLEKKDA